MQRSWPSAWDKARDTAEEGTEVEENRVSRKVRPQNLNAYRGITPKPKYLRPTPEAAVPLVPGVTRAAALNPMPADL